MNPIVMPTALPWTGGSVTSSFVKPGAPVVNAGPISEVEITALATGTVDTIVDEVVGEVVNKVCDEALPRLRPESGRFDDHTDVHVVVVVVVVVDTVFESDRWDVLVVTEVVTLEGDAESF